MLLSKKETDVLIKCFYSLSRSSYSSNNFGQPSAAIWNCQTFSLIELTDSFPPSNIFTVLFHSSWTPNENLNVFPKWPNLYFPLFDPNETVMFLFSRYAVGTFYYISFRSKNWKYKFAISHKKHQFLFAGHELLSSIGAVSYNAWFF